MIKLINQQQVLKAAKACTCYPGFILYTPSLIYRFQSRLLYCIAIFHLHGANLFSLDSTQQLLSRPLQFLSECLSFSPLPNIHLISFSKTVNSSEQLRQAQEKSTMRLWKTPEPQREISQEENGKGHPQPEKLYPLVRRCWLPSLL